MRRLMMISAVLFLILTKSVFSSSLVEVEGTLYYEGDLNYPVWSMGKRVGAIADLESAYIAFENEKWRQVAFGSYPFMFERARMEDGIIIDENLYRECYFWQKRSTGDVFFNRDGIAGRKVEGKAFDFEKRVFLMLLDSAVKNMGEGEEPSPTEGEEPGESPEVDEKQGSGENGTADDGSTSSESGESPEVDEERGSGESGTADDGSTSSESGEDLTSQNV